MRDTVRERESGRDTGRGRRFHAGSPMWDLILETWDQVPRWTHCMEPASPSPCVSVSLSLSLSLSLINK